jgi:hypothetical protein
LRKRYPGADAGKRAGKSAGPSQNALPNISDGRIGVNVSEFFESNIGWILVVSGVLTALAGAGAGVFPKSLLRLAFGVDNADGALVFFVMHWGVLIFVVGALLSVAANEPELRVPILLAGAIEKFAILGLVLFGPLKRTTAMTLIAAFDGSLAVIYSLCLLSVPH